MERGTRIAGVRGWGEGIIWQVGKGYERKRSGAMEILCLDLGCDYMVYIYIKKSCNCTLKSVYCLYTSIKISKR